MNSNNNNGKIVVAIVAMFVVALSIVGFTYAYFTASIAGNTQDSSVDVLAGVLKVNYTAGQTINATNIVPGWTSDSKMIYHPTASVDEAGNISAVSIEDVEDTTYDGNVVNPVTFSVQNTGDATNSAYYAIKLTSITNQIDDADKENLTVSLYEGTWSADTGIVADELVKTYVLGNTGSEQVISGVITTNGTRTDNYYLVVSYANIQGSQNNSMGKTVSATVEVVGLNNVGTAEAPSYVDANGATFTPAA